MLRRWAAITLDHERDLQVHFGFTRVAVALALFKAEKGKFPEQPASLAPEYLAEAFVPAPGWNSYKFSRGRLREVSLGLEWPEKQE
ncbi:MAG: hypothetical protein HY293_10505 [Planctomycetes bacterium]|nr:hypothetical protein [Planctomycetota bacterium]